METKDKYPFTKEQFDALTDAQKAALAAVATYLTDVLMEPTDESISETFNLLRPCECSVPEEELGDDLGNAIRRKFCAIYQVGMELAEQELRERGLKETKDFNFCLVVDPALGCSTHIVIVDYNEPRCYLHEWNKAWHVGFSDLASLADEVLRIKGVLVERVTDHCTKKDIFVVLDGGLVQKVIGLPVGYQARVIDYDVQGADEEELQASPLDGRLCWITDFEYEPPNH